MVKNKLFPMEKVIPVHASSASDPHFLVRFCCKLALSGSRWAHLFQNMDEMMRPSGASPPRPGARARGGGIARFPLDTWMGLRILLCYLRIVITKDNGTCTL